MMDHTNDSRTLGSARIAGLLALAALAASCVEGSASLPTDDGSVGNGTFGVTDGAPFMVTGPQGGPFPDGSRTYTLVNYTQSLFRWDLEATVPWLTSETLGGALGPMATSEVTLTLDPAYAATLPVGEYPADIVFTDRDHPDGTLVMAFLLTVVPPPTGDLVVTPEEGWLLEAAEAATLDGEQRTYVISNQGEGTLEWSAVSGDAWLMVEGPASGSLDPGASSQVTLSLHAAGLPASGSVHSGSVRFQNGGDASDLHDGLVQVRLGDGTSERVTQGLAALYTFEESGGSVVHDQAGALTGLDLHVEDPALVSWGPGSLSTQAGARLATAGPATSLAQALAGTGELTLEAWIAPEDVVQEGPARILSLSGGASTRNVTLGQGLWGDQPSDTYNVQLRTTETDPDGMPLLTTGPGAASVGLQHLAYTRTAQGIARLFVNGVERAYATTGGGFEGWSTQFGLLLGNEAQVERSWRGRYHLVAIFDRALSEGEVVQNFEAGTGDADGPLLVATPGTAFTASGEVGGTIAPLTQTYTLTNGGSAPLSWEALVDGGIAFVDGATSGTLEPDEVTLVVVRLDEAAIAGLGAGSYESVLMLTETTADAGSTSRPITLELTDDPSAGSGSASDGGGSSYGEKPEAHNTGPTAPDLLVESGSITITQDGAVIENVDVTGRIHVKANNVTIRNFRIAADGCWYGIQIDSGFVGALVEDGEITGALSAAMLGNDYTARRIHAHHLEADAFKHGSNVLIERCYVHHLGMQEGAHADGCQTRGGGNMTIRACNFDLPHPTSANSVGPGFRHNAASINQADLSDLTEVVLEGNWLNGGNYTVYFEVQDTYFPGLKIRDCALINNRFGRDHAFGVLRIDGDVEGLVVTGNVWDDTGELMEINQ